MSDIEQKCRVALQALSDWSVTYAPDMCDPETVEKAKARILEHGTLAYIANATDQLNAAIQLLSEAETREREARAKLQAMHRRAQESERVEQMIIDTLGMWYKLFQEGRFKPRAKRGLFFAVMKELKVKADKIREARSALQSEER